MADEEKMQQKYMQFQMLQQQMEQINGHLEQLNQKNAELEISINAVKELGKTKVNNEFLAPIADGVFLKGELKDNQKLIVNVGSDVTVEKNVTEVAELLEKQKESLTENMAHADLLMKEMSSQAMKLYQEIEKDVE